MRKRADLEQLILSSIQEDPNWFDPKGRASTEKNCINAVIQDHPIQGKVNNAAKFSRAEKSF